MDTITDPLRERTVYRLPDHGLGEWVKALFDCPWCIGFWICVAAVLLWRIDVEVTWWLALPFAFSTIVGLLWKLDDPT